MMERWPYRRPELELPDDRLPGHVFTFGARWRLHLGVVQAGAVVVLRILRLWSWAAKSLPMRSSWASETARRHHERAVRRRSALNSARRMQLEQLVAMANGSWDTPSSRTLFRSGGSDGPEGFNG